MSTIIFRDASLAPDDLYPPETLAEIDRCGRFGIYQSTSGPVALDDEHHEPTDWHVFRAGIRLKGTILHCKHLLRPGMLFCCDDAGESRCVPCMEAALALEDDAC